MKKKTLLIIFFAIIIFLFIWIISSSQRILKTYHILPKKIQTVIINSYYDLPENLRILTELYLSHSVSLRPISWKNFLNDYNVKFLPETQFLQLDFETKEIELKLESDEDNLEYKQPYPYAYAGDRTTYHLEVFENKIWLILSKGKILEIKIEDILNNKESKLKSKIINSDLRPKKILDTFIKDEIIYISYITKEYKCNYLNISFAKINNKYLNFKNFFSSYECGKNILGGRMQFFNHRNVEGLLLTTGDFFVDKPKLHNKTSIFNKILFIDFNTKKPINFSFGHRNSQGLYSEGNLILSTEHGPRGGDEINKIVFNNNYGWPVASYGSKYFTPKSYYLKNHADHGFKEPIFSFVPSIGISELIKLPNDFSDFWQNNFLIASLNDLSLYRVKFGKNYNKVIYYERIFVGQRIRDLKYHNGTDTILLALELQCFPRCEKGAILGIIKKK